MIQIDKVEVEFIRGIRGLSMEPKSKSYAIHGGNGTGKSSIVDAIEFCLTGDMSRFKGRGLQEVSITKHGAHIEKRQDLKACSVAIRLTTPLHSGPIVLRRNLKQPKKFVLDPDTPELQAVIKGLEGREEVTLARRDIVNFVLAPPDNRAEQVAVLLRLRSLRNNAKQLQKAANDLGRRADAANGEYGTRQASWLAHLRQGTSDDALALATVNQHLAAAGRPTAESLSDALQSASTDEVNEKPAFDPAAASLQLGEARKNLANKEAREAGESLQTRITLLASDPLLAKAADQRVLIETGLAASIADECPLCDQPWNLDELRAHLKEKLKKSEYAAAVLTQIETGRAVYLDWLRTTRQQLSDAINIAKRLQASGVVDELEVVKRRVDDIGGQLKNAHTIAQLTGCVTLWEQPPELIYAIGQLETQLEALPRVSATAASIAWIAIAKEKYQAVLTSLKIRDTTTRAAKIAAVVHRYYSDAVRSELELLYSSVERSFVGAYRKIHSDDEADFDAKFRDDGGKLMLTVDFLGSKDQPPAAYHSEGHQDTMGLCLYLALMKQVFGNDLRMIILDDVVMSVDSGHRHEICKMLSEQFPGTQFIVTTHDETWFRQIQSSPLMSPANGLVLQSWSLETGPCAGDAVTAWEVVEGYLLKSQVQAAAAALRHHLEFAARETAIALAAPIPMRGDNRFEGGELLNASYSALIKRLKEAKNHAGRYKLDDAIAAASELETELSAAWLDVNNDNWAVNSAVHYNRWMNMSAAEFRPVVKAFRRLLDCFRCQHPSCSSWLRLSSRINAASFRCDCGRMTFHLKNPQ